MKCTFDHIKSYAEGNNCPILFSGDLFDRYNPPAELVNWMADHMPTIWGIPGQHDLPFHRYEDIKKSAFWTLVKLGKIHLIKPGETVEFQKQKMIVHGFPWGFPVKPCDEVQNGYIKVALIHAYCWMPLYSYPNAPTENLAGSWMEKLKGYDVAVFGDNHKGFSISGTPPKIINGGTTICRKYDEKDYRPFVGTICNDGSIGRMYLDTTKDRWIEVVNPNKLDDVTAAYTDIAKELGQLGDAAVNFGEAVKWYIEKNKVTRDEVRKIILEALEDNL
jgi:DNA repair exonuclease SbcCD nuclease subunit